MNFDESISIFIRSFLLMAGALIPVINPPGAAPIFLSFTKGASRATRNILAKRIAMYTFIMLTISTWIGNLILSFFGISIPVIRVAGGFLVVAAAWGLLNAKEVDADTTEAYSETISLEKAKRSAFFPFTFPMLCGPGSLSAAITVGAAVHGFSATNSHLLISGVSGTIAGIFVVALTIFFSLRFATPFLSLLGETGTIIFMKLSAFLLLCIGVQVMWIGLHDLITSLYHEIYISSITR